MRLPSTTIAKRTGVESTSTSRCYPLGTDTDSPFWGGMSKPQVEGSDQSETYLNTRPKVATSP